MVNATRHGKSLIRPPRGNARRGGACARLMGDMRASFRLVVPVLPPTLTWSPLGSPTVDYAVFSAKTTTSTASEATPDALRGAGSVGSGQHAPLSSEDHPGIGGTISSAAGTTHLRPVDFRSVGPGYGSARSPHPVAGSRPWEDGVATPSRSPPRPRIAPSPWYPVRADRSVLTRGVGPYMGETMTENPRTSH